MMSCEVEPLTALVPAELLARIEAEAARQGVSPAVVIAAAIAEELPQALAAAAAARLRSMSPESCEVVKVKLRPREVRRALSPPLEVEVRSRESLPGLAASLGRAEPLEVHSSPTPQLKESRLSGTPSDHLPTGPRMARLSAPMTSIPGTAPVPHQESDRAHFITT